MPVNDLMPYLVFSTISRYIQLIDVVLIAVPIGKEFQVFATIRDASSPQVPFIIDSNACSNKDTATLKCMIKCYKWLKERSCKCEEGNAYSAAMGLCELDPVFGPDLRKL
ncbi:hypothetical protein SCHPADRAFT_890802 [Schizopora paradoxa]|uniref:Uncharacterized protein n=1 Tax=Schizopora paradoxa TaxID=27342 RepID=A0A0H2S6H9_9AGAM|nr:hypothetical protein SCHPADRAFT_890802 [Schizopora paradoxa]